MSQRPAEDAAYQARQAAEAQVLRDIASDPHTREMHASHQGQPTVAVQDRTHGAGIPRADHGKGS